MYQLCDLSSLTWRTSVFPEIFFIKIYILNVNTGDVFMICSRTYSGRTSAQSPKLIFGVPFNRTSCVPRIGTRPSQWTRGRSSTCASAARSLASRQSSSTCASIFLFLLYFSFFFLFSLSFFAFSLFLFVLKCSYRYVYCTLYSTCAFVQ